MKFDPYQTTIGRLLDMAVENYPENIAVISSAKDRLINYKKLGETVVRYAKGLIAAGVEKGEHVAVWSNNIEEWIYLNFACAKIGAAVVTVNTNYRAGELEYLLRQSDSKTFFTVGGVNRENEYIEIVNEVFPELLTSAPGNLESPKAPLLKRIIYMGTEKVPGMIDLDEMLEAGKDVADAELSKRRSEVMPGDVAMIQYTSGTTGFPKGVMIKHNNFVFNADMLNDSMNFTEADRYLIPAPFFHYMGSVSVVASLVRGAASVTVERFKPAEVLEIIRKYECSAIIAVPTMFITLLNEFDMNGHKRSNFHLKKGVIAGMASPDGLIERLAGEFGMHSLLSLYGQTEIGCITRTLPGDDVELVAKTVGRPIPDLEIKIADTRTGKTMEASGHGEVCCRSSLVSSYYKMDEETHKIIDAEGWLHSGDIGMLDKNLNCSIIGRLKDLIIMGGENIYPREIEDFMMKNPKIKDAQVVGVPSPVYGEKVVAFVQMNAGCEASESELKTFCRDKISQHKVPSRFFFVDEFPRNASGKIQKFKLVEMAKEIYK